MSELQGDRARVGEDRGVPFLAMEFLDGEPLDRRLKREGKLTVVEVLRFGREIAVGLAAAHKRGLIHRLVAVVPIHGTCLPGVPAFLSYSRCVHASARD